MAVADLNGDNNLDVVIANSGNNFLSVLLGKGDGTFAAPAKAPGGDSPTAVTVADLNGDGIPDLAVISVLDAVEATVETLAGNGDGTFAPPAFFGGGNLPEFISSGVFLSSKPSMDLLLLTTPLSNQGAGSIVESVMLNSSK